MHPLDTYIPIAQSVATLLQPYAEAVIHDLKTGKIHAILNPYSRRKKGDASLLDKEIQRAELPDYFEPYLKTNWDGKKLKSVTSTLRDAKGKPIGLLCFNLDISKWEEFSRLFEHFVAAPKELPKELFLEDWKEKISLYIATKLKTKQLILEHLTRDQKKELIFELHKEGAFEGKNAAAYVGDVLELSRATVYKYLNEKT
ncbi:MAG: PAS domain-containing protein [Verrucomicrobia bacterium]|nr:PAS domain-containing protein [Verrucomicrobiota bacterium]